MLLAWVYGCAVHGHYAVHWASARCMYAQYTPMRVHPCRAYNKMVMGMHLIALVGTSCHARAQYVWVQVAFSNPLSPLMGSGTLSEPNTCQRIFLEPHLDLSIFYIDQIHIILSRIQLKILQCWNYTSAPPIHKRIRFMSYKYTINPSSQRFTISSFSTAYIFSEYLSLKYYCTFSLYKVTGFIVGESHVHQRGLFAGTSYRLPGLLDITCYQLLILWVFHIKSPDILTMKNGSDCLN
jgi:hypothetical protein